MSWSERFGSKLSGRHNAIANDSAALGGRASRSTGAGGLDGLGSRAAERTSGISSAVNGVTPIRSRMLDYDYSLMWVTILLLGLGIVMVYSASIAMPDSKKYASYHDYAFLLRQIMFVVMGSVVGVISFRIPTSTWDKYAPKLFVASIFMLVIVLIPHIGKGVNGARRWIPLGITNMQPSEIMKLAVTIYAANYTVRKQEFMHSFGRGFLPMAVAVGFVGALLLLEPDMGAFMVIAVVAMGVLFLGGVNAKLFGGLVATAVGTFALLVWASPWRRERIFA
ncbi:FtsW/RodA/SpoVE family cell cycle protein, partial [Caballeronia sp.]|uniref:FtsW/RodA/SpoVE family cell cycle protein n=1 Tax=Caballeronia sp. TaxID=1931223 RepID=UPI003C536C17